MQGRLLEANPWYQLLIVFLLAMFGTVLFLAISIVLTPLFFEVGYIELFSIFGSLVDGSHIEILKFIQAFNTLGTFMFPAIVGAFLLSKKPWQYLAVLQFPKPFVSVSILAILLILSGTAISDALYRLTAAIPFPSFLQDFQLLLQESQSTMEAQIEALLQMDSFVAFIGIFIVMAVLPALCEEFLFRGVIQSLFIKAFGNLHWGIVITSVVFAFLHQQFYSFLSIMALSVVLGYVRYWSRSLWPSILMHLVNNGTIVIGVYFFDMPMDDVNAATSDWNPVYFIGSTLVFSIALYALYKVLATNNSNN